MACGSYAAPMDPNGLDALLAERAIRDVWLIAHRVCVFDWTRTDPVTGWQFTDAFRRGRTDGDVVVFSPSLRDVIDAGGANR